MEKAIEETSLNVQISFRQRGTKMIHGHAVQDGQKGPTHVLRGLYSMRVSSEVSLGRTTTTNEKCDHVRYSRSVIEAGELTFLRFSAASSGVCPIDRCAVRKTQEMSEKIDRRLTGKLTGRGLMDHLLRRGSMCAEGCRRADFTNYRFHDGQASTRADNAHTTRIQQQRVKQNKASITKRLKTNKTRNIETAKRKIKQLSIPSSEKKRERQTCKKQTRNRTKKNSLVLHELEETMPEEQGARLQTQGRRKLHR